MLRKFMFSKPPTFVQPPNIFATANISSKPPPTRPVSSDAAFLKSLSLIALVKSIPDAAINPNSPVGIAVYCVV